jgi:hypothetical protein
MSNVCIRCGKERIVIKEWIEEIPSERKGNIITYRKTSCPDPECQKLVDKGIAREKQKTDERKAEKLENDRIQREERQKRVEQIMLKPEKKSGKRR